jgi:hypothetical protein
MNGGESPEVKGVEPREEKPYGTDMAFFNLAQEIMEKGSLLSPMSRISELASISTEMGNWMIECWRINPQERPTFDHMYSKFKNYSSTVNLFIKK